jgi:ComF family protein
MVYGFLKRLFVESCPGCGGTSESGFCVVCADELTRIVNPCGRCGLAEPVARCPRRRTRWRVDAVHAPFDYAPPLDHYLYAFKYHGARAMGRAFAALIAPGLEKPSAEIDALVAVPLHRARLRERGYNQALEIARGLARELELPLLERGINRSAATGRQTGRGARERLAGMQHAFRVRRELGGLRIAIVDDVVTTGATINALAAELLAAGARSCIAFAVARTPERRMEPQATRNV